jgi:hypothetical protein
MAETLSHEDAVPVTVNAAGQPVSGVQPAHPATHPRRAETAGVAGVFRDITAVEDEVFHLAEHTLVDALHLTGRVATVAVSETTHVLGSVVRGVMHVLTRALPKGSDLRETYTMAEAAEEILPEVERVLPLL